MILYSSDVNKKKIQIILIVLAFSVVGAVILSVVNIHQDRMEMHTFYKVCSVVQCSAAVQCSAVQCSAVQCSAVQCSAVQCRTDAEHSGHCPVGSLVTDWLDTTS
jgi:hypothetical protein